MRKEIEAVTVERANMLEDAVRLGVAGALSGRVYRLFRRIVDRDETITDDEVASLKEAFAAKAPWTPWQGVNYV